MVHVGSTPATPTMSREGLIEHFKQVHHDDVHGWMDDLRFMAFHHRRIHYENDLSWYSEPHTHSWIHSGKW